MMLVEALLPEWDREMGLTRQLLARLPEGQLAWRPHDTSWALGQLAGHLAHIPGWAVSIIDKPSSEQGPHRQDDGPATLPVLLESFDANATAGRAVLVGKTDAELQAPWSLLALGREVVTMPRAAALRNFVFNHQVHHRGQLSVYLRLLGVRVPSMYGPSGDES